MKPAQLLFEHQRLVERERALRENIARVTSRLESDPEVVEREATLTEARAAQEATAARVRESDHEREAHRSRLRTREKELMSGRIRNPTELMQMSEEVQHMKARFAEEEDAELRLMEDADAADQAVRKATAQLEATRRQSTSREPARCLELCGGFANGLVGGIRVLHQPQLCVLFLGEARFHVLNFFRHLHQLGRIANPSAHQLFLASA